MRTNKAYKHISAAFVLSAAYMIRDIARYWTQYINYITMILTMTAAVAGVYLLLSSYKNMKVRLIMALPLLAAVTFGFNNQKWNKAVSRVGFYVLRETGSSSIKDCRQRYVNDDKPALCFYMEWDLETDAYHAIVYSPLRVLQEYGGTNSEDWIRMLDFIPSVRPSRLTALSAVDLGDGFYDVTVPNGAFGG